jgi:hypothetical protein
MDNGIRLRFITANNRMNASLICRDCGPAYAQSLRLPWSDVDSLGDLSEKSAVIVDSTLNDAEVMRVRNLIDRETTLVLLKVVDPYWSRDTRGSDRSSYTRLVETQCSRPNVAILSPYEPKEWLKEVVDHLKPRLIVLPYPYVPEAEQSLTPDNFAARRDRAVLTGAHSGRKYPQRARIHRLRHILANYRNNFDLLEHPGYPTLGQARRHNLVFDDFLKFIAGYKTFYICPSRADLEFLKYTECAQAGCAPVGIPATSMPAAAKELFLDTPTFLRSMRQQPAALRNADHFTRAVEYRSVMATSRKAEKLREQLVDFVASTCN